MAKTDSHYWGVFGEYPEFLNNEDWHVDIGVPYPYGLPACQTADDPFSIGRVFVEDVPALAVKAPFTYLQHGQQKFETCIVALEGAEGMDLTVNDPESFQEGQAA